MVEAGAVAAEQWTSNQDSQQAFDFEGHTFKVPDKTLITVGHVEEFKTSSGCTELMGFITALVTECKTSQMSTTPLTEVSSISPLFIIPKTIIYVLFFSDILIHFSLVI